MWPDEMCVSLFYFESLVYCWFMSSRLYHIMTLCNVALALKFVLSMFVHSV